MGVKVTLLDDVGDGLGGVDVGADVVTSKAVGDGLGGDAVGS